MAVAVAVAVRVALEATGQVVMEMGARVMGMVEAR